MAFRKKYKHLVKCDPDVIVVQECEKPSIIRKKSDFPGCDSLWVGDNRHKGVGVFGLSGWRVSLHPDYDDSFRYIVPVVAKKDGYRLNVVAVWAMNNTTDRKRRYIGEVYLALKEYAKILKSDPPVIVAGDFNWNVQWDANPTYSLYGNLTDVRESLESRGIESLYHFQTGVDFGKESQPTYYQYRRQSRSYHTDYVFCSDELRRTLQDFAVGEFDDWCSYSDHVPLICGFDLERTD